MCSDTTTRQKKKLKIINMYIVDISRKTYERNGVETLRDNDGEKI